MKKIKLTYLLLGMGIGVILVNSLYLLCPKIEYIDLSDEMIIDKAKELGYISLKENIMKENKSEKNLEFERIGKKEKSVEIKIEEGDNLSDIAEKLFKTNLIDNKKEFILLAEDKMVDNKFAYGVFNIKYNTSYSTIIELLIK